MRKKELSSLTISLSVCMRIIFPASSPMIVFANCLLITKVNRKTCNLRCFCSVRKSRQLKVRVPMWKGSCPLSSGSQIFRSCPPVSCMSSLRRLWFMWLLIHTARRSADKKSTLTIRALVSLKSQKFMPRGKNKKNGIAVKLYRFSLAPR